MLIAGAKGFAKEVLAVLYQFEKPAPIAFFDDVSTDLPAKLYDRFAVLRTPEEVQHWLQQDNQFTLGVGNPLIRRHLTQKLQALGGVLTSVVSPRATVGMFGNSIGTGCSIMSGTVLTQDITLGNGVLLNLNCTVGHDSTIGAYCELSPGVHLSGHVTLGENCVLGTGAVVLPGVSIGPNAVIGAGSVVTKDVEAHVVMAGVPAKLLRRLS